MSHKPTDRKKREAKDSIISELGGGLFNLDLEEVPEDPILSMRKYVMHFRLMVLSDRFPLIHQGSLLTYGKPGTYPYSQGVVQASGIIDIPAIRSAAPSLTSYASQVTPDKWTKTDSKTGRVSKAKPDGWERVWITLDDGSSMRVEDLLFSHYRDLGYTVEELSNVELIYNDLVKAGHGEVLEDLKPEVKAYRTKIKKAESLGKNVKSS